MIEPVEILWQPAGFNLPSSARGPWSTSPTATRRTSACRSACCRSTRPRSPRVPRSGRPGSTRSWPSSRAGSARARRRSRPPRRTPAAAAGDGQGRHPPVQPGRGGLGVPEGADRGPAGAAGRPAALALHPRRRPALRRQCPAPRLSWPELTAAGACGAAAEGAGHLQPRPCRERLGGTLRHLSVDPGRADLPLLIAAAVDASRRNAASGPSRSCFSPTSTAPSSGCTTSRGLVAGERVAARDRFAWRERYCADMRDRRLHGPED